MSIYNPDLMQIAEWAINQHELLKKEAFQPPGGDPSQGGAAAGGAPPGMDPSMAAAGGGAPPGGMDPSAAAVGGVGGPGMDPSMAAAGGAAGGMPPSSGGGDPMAGAGGLTSDSIRQIIRDEMARGAGMGGAGGAAGGKPAKANPEAMSMDIFQIKKMLSHLFNTMGIPLPNDILDGPNRDPSTGMPMPPGAPGSTSDPSMQSQSAAQPAAGGAGGAQSAIPPMDAMQAAMPQAPGAGGGAAKSASAKSLEDILHIGRSYNKDFNSVVSRASALSTLYKKIQR